MTLTSWWTDPAVQFDRVAFSAAVLAELPRMLTDKTRAAKVDGMVIGHWPGRQSIGLKVTR